jgi:RND family efflux transporter MFP subunit
MRPVFTTRARIVAAMVVALIAILIVVVIATRKDDNPPATAEPVAAVVTALAVHGTLSPAALAYGTVVSSPGHTRVIVMPHDGTIASVAVLDGEAVRAGQPLVTITIAPAAAAQYLQARAARDFAKGDLARVERLFADKLATNEQIATAQKALSDAQSQLDQLEQTGADRAAYTLPAPFDGVITTVTAAPGDRPQVGAPLATLASRTDVVVQLNLEPADAAKLTPGAQVRFALPSGDSAAGIIGRLSAVGSAIDPVSHLVRAVAQIPAADTPRVTLGMTLAAHIDLPARQGVIVPRGALLEDAGGPYLFTVVAQKAHRQAVQIAVETNAAVLIETGLESGARVIVSGNAALEDGMAVAEASQ